jgi:hypothetical protein
MVSPTSGAERPFVKPVPVGARVAGPALVAGAEGRLADRLARPTLPQLGDRFRHRRARHRLLPALSQ